MLKPLCLLALLAASPLAADDWGGAPPTTWKCAERNGCDSGSSSSDTSYHSRPDLPRVGSWTSNYWTKAKNCPNLICAWGTMIFGMPIGLIVDSPVFLYVGLRNGLYYGGKGLYYTGVGVGKGVAAVGRGVAYPFTRPPKPPKNWEDYKYAVLKNRKKLAKRGPVEKAQYDWCVAHVPLEISAGRALWEERCNAGMISTARLPPMTAPAVETAAAAPAAVPASAAAPGAPSATAAAATAAAEAPAAAPSQAALPASPVAESSAEQTVVAQGVAPAAANLNETAPGQPATPSPMPAGTLPASRGNSVAAPQGRSEAAASHDQVVDKVAAVLSPASNPGVPASDTAASKGARAGFDDGGAPLQSETIKKAPEPAMKLEAAAKPVVVPKKFVPTAEAARVACGLKLAGDLTGLAERAQTERDAAKLASLRASAAAALDGGAGCGKLAPAQVAAGWTERNRPEFSSLLIRAETAGKKKIDALTDAQEKLKLARELAAIKGELKSLARKP